MNDLPLQNTIINTIGLYQNFYKPETFQHCLSVARYVYENVCLETEEEKISQTDTITDKLKEKYWKALPELL